MEGNAQSRILQSRICLSTSGQTRACTSLYCGMNSGLSLTIWPKRRPGLGTLDVGDEGAELMGLANGDDGFAHMVAGVLHRFEARPAILGLRGA